MKPLIVLAGGLIGTVAGWVAAAAATIAFGGYLGLMEFEGERSMTAVFGIGPAGGLIGLAVGLWLGLRLRRT